MSAARRVLSSDPPSKLEKPTALALFALLAMAVVLPLRFAIVMPADFELGTAVGIGVALFAPYFACVLAVTPSSTGRARGGLFSASAAPHLTALALVAIGLVLMLACYGHQRGDRVLDERAAILCAHGLGAHCADLLAVGVDAHSRRRRSSRVLGFHRGPRRACKCPRSSSSPSAKARTVSRCCSPDSASRSESRCRCSSRGASVAPIARFC